MSSRRHDRGGGVPSDPRPSLLSDAVARLRRDPRLVVPFVLLGLVIAAVDALRRRDPLPVVERTVVGNGGLDVRIEYAGYPTGVPETRVPVESLVDLRPGYLAWELGLTVLPLLATAAAGAYAMRRAMDAGEPATADTGADRDGRSGNGTRTAHDAPGDGEGRAWFGAVAPLFGYALAMDLAHRLLGSVDALQGMDLWGIVPLAAVLFVLVRLFAVPGLLVAGRSPGRALAESVRLTRGNGWPVFGAILGVGLAAWLLAGVPTAGALVSSALVAPIHAAVVVAFVERTT